MGVVVFRRLAYEEQGDVWLATKVAPERPPYTVGQEVRLRGLPGRALACHMAGGGSLKPAQAGFVAERSEAVQARFQPPAARGKRPLTHMQVDSEKTHGNGNHQGVGDDAQGVGQEADHRLLS